MSDEITPALTPDEWAEQLQQSRDPDISEGAGEMVFELDKGHGEFWLGPSPIWPEYDSSYDDPSLPEPEPAYVPAVCISGDNPTWIRAEEDRHRVAALCLHGQPFGFTWDDVEMIRWAADVIQDEGINLQRAMDLRFTADRIAALLPPSA